MRREGERGIEREKEDKEIIPINVKAWVIEPFWTTAPKGPTDGPTNPQSRV